MDNDGQFSNPYGESSLAPFAGRQAAFARLYQHLTAPRVKGAMTFLGRKRLGKTALLTHFETFFDETFVGVYLPLKEMTPDDEDDWLLTLAREATKALVRHSFTLSRLSELEPPSSGLSGWWSEQFLPEMLTIIRPHRRLVFLVDDADVLLDMMSAGKLTPGSFATMHGLLEKHPQLSMALTADAERETDLARMSPLVNLTHNVFRLSALTTDEALWLLRQPVTGLYNVPDDCATIIYRLTGGEPGLLQRFGHELYERWQAYTDLNVITLDDVKGLTPRVYAQSAPELREIWQRLTLNERLALTAISGLLYGDPLRSIDTAAIEAWLIETDYPMDATTINAALRGLEYREIVALTPSGLMLSTGLMQTWLLENARLDNRPSAAASAVRIQKPRPANLPRPRLIYAAGIGLALLILALILISLSSTPRPPTNGDSQPTVTLVNPP
jgi:hypothetical protein